MNLWRPRTQDRDFADFVVGHRGRLLSTAELLTAGDAHLAEDLVQVALVRVYLGWARIRGEPAAYARRVLVNSFIDHRRKPFVSRERASETLPDTAATVGATVGATERPAEIDPVLVRALAELPQRMRAAVVLRHVQDLSVGETARLLGCSPGTVKSQTARGLDKLRTSLDAASDVPDPGPATVTDPATPTSAGERS